MMTLFESIKQLRITERFLVNYIVYNNTVIFVLNEGEGDVLNFFNLDSLRNFALGGFVEIEYFSRFDNFILVNDKGRKSLVLVEVNRAEVVDELDGLYYCAKDIRKGELLFCVNRVDGIDTIRLIQVLNGRITSAATNVGRKTNYVHDNYSFRKIHNILLCNSLSSGEEIWRFSTDSVRQDGMIAPDGIWFIDDKVVLRTEADFNKGFAGPNYLVWLDINTGEILFKRNDAKPMMRRVEDDLYYLDMPFSDAGYFKVISLKNGSTKVDIPTRDIFESYATVNRVSDNYTYSKQGSDLCILHINSRSITVMDLIDFAIKDHFKVETSGRYLRDIQFCEKSIFVVDDLKVLHIFQKKVK